MIDSAFDRQHDIYCFNVQVAMSYTKQTKQYTHIRKLRYHGLRSCASPVNSDWLNLDALSLDFCVRLGLNFHPMGEFERGAKGGRVGWVRDIFFVTHGRTET